MTADPSRALRWIERGRVPDALVRWGIRRALARRLRREDPGGPEAEAERVQTAVADLSAAPLRVDADLANAQHYEVPAAFFEQVLGRHRKYSCGLWSADTATLDDAEEAMLDLTLARADLRDGQRVLDLGCGWGAFTLHAAARHPASTFLAVSNSHAQGAFVRQRAREAGLANVQVQTVDVLAFDPGTTFDRVVSVEMFEHMRNWKELLRRIASWLTPEGRLFVHVFVHDRWPYRFEADDADSWMARTFFSGGQMPSDDLLLHFQDDLVVEGHWRVAGTHYARTARAWLDHLDARRPAVEAALASASPDRPPPPTVGAWRLFFMACEELWKWRGGRTWYVSHYALRPRAARQVR